MNKALIKAASGVAAATLIAGFGASVAFAQADVQVGANVLGASATVSANASAGGSGQTKLQAKITAEISKMQTRAEQEIGRRIDALQKMTVRIDDMKKVSANDQVSIKTSVQAQIDALTSLKTKIQGDTSTTTLKADVKSITDSYRIYMLVMPQTSILAAVDRVNTTAGQMQTLGGKLQARVASSTATSTNISAAQTALADFNAKVSDAKVQAQAAHDLVINLKPDNGDKTVQQSNETALKSARGKIQLAQQDLVAARKDAETVLKDIRVHMELHANATTSAAVH